MNEIKKKIICLALSLAFLGATSQAQTVDHDSEPLVYHWKINPGEMRTILKGLFMERQDWQTFGMLGIEEKLEKLKNGTISATTASFGICRNFALANGYDSTRGICTIGEALSSDNTAFEKIVEGGAYFAKGFGFTYHNQLIGWSKILTLKQEDSSQRLFYPNGVTHQDCEEEAAKTFKLIESLAEISPLYFTNKHLFYWIKGANRIEDVVAKLLLRELDDKLDYSGFVTFNRVGRAFTYDVLNVHAKLMLLPIPIIHIVAPAYTYVKLLHQLTVEFNNDDDSIPMSVNIRKHIPGQREPSALEILGDSNFREASNNLNLEETRSIKKALSFYKQALGYYTSGAAWKDGDSESKSHCEDMENKCLEKIGKLINHLKINVLFKLSEGECEKQNSSSTFGRCVTKIYGAKNETEIKEALIEYKKSTRSLWANMVKMFSSNNDQLEQLIGQF
ncbi:MAG: hypothetical protein LBQ04_00435 [Endomicrobium sp.]|jgi:hypothetical protein|nr:hypothetical protein [Endomicrobium sp.]